MNRKDTDGEDGIFTDMRINGKCVLTNGYFGYDGCHKIYICESHAECEELREYGYKILPIAELPKTYANSCPLRFISSANLMVDYVKQCCNRVNFSGFSA